MRALLWQHWRDRRAAVIGWCLGWSVLVGMYVATWPTVRAHAHQYDEILAGLPRAMRAAIGAEGGGAFSTPGGYLTAELLGVTGPIVAVTMGVLLGVASLARDEEDGTVELLLVQPISRTKLLLARSVAALGEVVALLLLTSLVLWLLGLAVGLGLGIAACLRAMVMLALLSCEGLSLSLLFGAVTGRAARTRALAGGVGLLAFLLAALGPSISWLQSLVGISPFHTLVRSDPFRRVPPGSAVFTLVAPTVVMVGIAVVAYRRRDLRLR